MKKIEEYIFLLVWTAMRHIEYVNTKPEDYTGNEVDKFINNYVEEVTRTLRISLDQHVINKRSLPDIDLNKLTGLELLVGFEEIYSVPALRPHDLVLFNHCQPNENKLYAAALKAQSAESRDSQVSQLVLYKYQEGSWVEKHRVQAAEGRSLAVEQTRDSVYIVVAQHLADENLGSTVWRLPRDSDKLQFVHILNTHFASHAITWTDTKTCYTAVAISENVAGSTNVYSTLSPVYRWQGSSFDMIDALPTNNPRALAQFNIRSSVFVAVANFQNDLGETTVDSDIFRYDLTSGKFNVYQKIPTEAAVDVKYFCFHSDEMTESFLIYASEFHTDEQGNRDYNAPSIVYKLSDEEYFVPFQALRAARVTSWLPVQHHRGGLESLTLIGASEDGIICFQYDGWRFVPTGLFDMSTFGPGSKSLNVFYSNDQTFISVANAESDDYNTNVFIPVLEYHPDVEHLERTVTKWVEVMTQEIIEVDERMGQLAKILREAPSINDPVVQAGYQAEFRDAQVYLLETFATKVGDLDADAEVYRKLNHLKNQLETINQSLLQLPSRINETSHTKLEVYEDILEDSADITCTQTCHVEQLEAININNENIRDFIESTVNVNHPVEFQDEVTFDELAVISPLNTEMINGHRRETLIDWSRDIVIDHKFKVEGDVLAKDSVSVSGAVDGVLLNVVSNEDSFASGARYIESLRTSQLDLSDGKISEVNFRNFVSSTLKVHGNQTFSVFQDVERIEAGDVTSVIFKAIQPPPSLLQQKACEDENCRRSRQVSQHSREHKIESINLLDTIIVPGSITLSGTLIVENGSLATNDFIDNAYNVSALNILKSALPLSQPKLNQHFTFIGKLKTPMVNTDTVNSVPLESFVNLEEENSVRLTGRKVFQGPLAVNGTLNVNGGVNTLVTKQLEEPNEELEEMYFDYFKSKEIKGRIVMLGKNDWMKHAVMKEDRTAVMQTIHVEENVISNIVMVRGNINNYQLERLLSDSVFEDDDIVNITGTKHIIGNCEIQSLNVSNLKSENFHFVSAGSLWRKRLMNAKRVEVEKLYYTGKLDGVLSTEFGKWLLTEGDQTMAFTNTIQHLQAGSVTMSPGATLNAIDISHLLSQAVSIHDNATFDSVVFEKEVNSSAVLVGGKMNGLKVPADIVIADMTSSVAQLITGHKRVLGNVLLGGDLHTSHLMSDFNITAYCTLVNSNHSTLTITGNGIFTEEPDVLKSVNNIEWSNIIHDIWLKDDNVTILKKVSMNEVEVKELYVKNINNNNVEEQFSKLVSLSADQHVTGTFYFSDVRADRGLEAGKAVVGGDVQGIHLSSFIKHILLNGVNQQVKGYLDFPSIIIENGFENMGFLNGLNVSSDLMLADAASNTMTAPLVLSELSTLSLRLPPAASVAGVDLSRWSDTAVTKSGSDRVVHGNVRVSGQLDSSQGIRVEQLVNGLSFDKNHILLTSGSQEVTGKVKFSLPSKLEIHNLQVERFLNNLNITQFYHQQVTASGDVNISGYKRFTAPLWSEMVVLPEIYQSHNLTWLEYQLSAPLPLSSYFSHQAVIQQSHQLALKCLAGRPYYLKNMTRAGDVEGDVLFTLPLKSGNTSSLGVVRRDSEKNRLTLSLLHWSDKHNMFLQLPESVDYFPRVVPSEVHTITLPGGELAAYVTSYLPNNKSLPVGHADLLRLRDGRITQSTIYRGKPGSSLLSFLDYEARTCFVVVAERCRVYCQAEGRQRVRSFPCFNITKATIFTTDRGPYILGIQTRPKGSLLLWRMSGGRIMLVHEMTQFNPVSIAATTSNGPHIAVANQHLLGHSYPETVDIYRLDENTSQLLLQQSLAVASPHLVMFSSLPSSESLLYVASTLPASPLQVYIYRGILGYRLVSSHPTLPTPSDLQPFTDQHRRYFLVVPSGHTANVLKANFEVGV